VFWQVKIAKDDLQTRCERESASAAVDLAEKIWERAYTFN